MGRGLGKVQRRILEVLEQVSNNQASVQMVVLYVYHPERFEWEGEYYFGHDALREDGGDPHECSRSEYVSVHRAVNTLEKRGLVSTEIRTTHQSGGANKWKTVKLLSVDS